MGADMHDNELSLEIERMIDNVLNGDADSHETSLLEEWVMESPDNRRVFEQRRALHEVLKPQFAPESVDTEKALAVLHHRMGMRISWRMVLLQFAAVIVLPLCAITMYLLVRTPSIPDDNTMLSISAPFGGLLQTRLPDGSQVWLNTNSSLEYPAVFDSRERRVTLHGEGYFEIKADKEHPFIVSTGDINIKAIGTAFNVNAYLNTTIDVTLVNGHVDVDAGSDRYFKMSPNEHLSINNSTADLSRVTDCEKRCSWKDGRLIFDNDRLDAVLTRLSQIYPVDFIIQDSTLAMTRYHATFNGEGIQDIIHLLEVGVPMRCETALKKNSNQRTIVYVYPVEH